MAFYRKSNRAQTMEQVGMRITMDADLSSCFNWNIKQLFVWIAIEYPTSKVCLPVGSVK